MIPYMVGKLAQTSTHFTRELVKLVPGRGYFRAVPSQNGHKSVTSPPPPIVLMIVRLLPPKMLSRYRATRVSLHVRKSNRGAIRLYEEQLNYKVAGVAPAYYSDGEDAFLMQAELPVKSELPTTQQVGSKLLPKSRGSHAPPDDVV